MKYRITQNPDSHQYFLELWSDFAKDGWKVMENLGDNLKTPEAQQKIAKQLSMDLDSVEFRRSYLERVRLERVGGETVTIQEFTVNY